jgi:restriction system protein
MQRAQEQQNRRRDREHTALARESARLRSEYERAEAAASRAEASAQAATRKEQARLYLESQVAKVNLQNEQLEQQLAQLGAVLSDTLPVDNFLDFEKLKESVDLPRFTPGPLAEAEDPPSPEAFFPPKPLLMFLPGGRIGMRRRLTRQRPDSVLALEEHSLREADRSRRLKDAERAHEREITEIKRTLDLQHQEVEEFRRNFEAADPGALVSYFALVLEASSYPEGFPQQFKLAFVPESKQLVIEYFFPTIDIVPTNSAYKYARAQDTITTVQRSSAKCRLIYSNVLAQVTLRTLHELFEADRSEKIETIVFNGHVETIDRATGRVIKPCLITVRTTRTLFNSLDLHNVDPLACLKGLSASVSKSPSELVPVRPVLDFNMVDARFVEETDVLSDLDQRPNLMELTPSEFESLITNLFERMGLDTRLTRASRDGGVDCVAYDPRPVLGGKVVIQAKRYANTVGVSAVRDLYGTMINEGASKGILVTTSGYGQAAFEFASGKPLELLSGANLLHLLAEHTDIQAKIEVPEDWLEPRPE